MSWIDLLRMSASNLKRRKLRTVLTVLGVIIGTTSIVVMISLGLGMQQSLYREVEQSGGLTTIRVSGQGAGEAMIEYGTDGEQQDSEKYINDEVIEEFRELGHVTTVSPVYEITAVALKGKYEGYLSLKAMTREGLQSLQLDLLPGGRLPEKGKDLEVVYGNQVLSSFYEKGNYEGYWETGELPEIDLTRDPLFFVFDEEAYQNQAADAGQSAPENGTEGGEVKSAKKHVVKSSGVMPGDIEDYNAEGYYVYCDLDVLKQILKKEFSGRVIPGQPSTRSGKPYKDFYYTSAQIKVEDIAYVNDVADLIRQKGYQVETNAEYLESMQREFAMVEAVLGGIGAISLFVAAIGIANTMMMSIYERTKEIGVIKVLGCSLKNIRQMFLLEAASIGFFGGVTGNILSLLLSALINFLTGQGMSGMSGNVSYIPLWLMAVSTGFAVLVGVAAGYFPAKRAMNLSPLAAIRSE